MSRGSNENLCLIQSPLVGLHQFSSSRDLSRWTISMKTHISASWHWNANSIFIFSSILLDFFFYFIVPITCFIIHPKSVFWGFSKVKNASSTQLVCLYEYKNFFLNFLPQRNHPKCPLKLKTRLLPSTAHTNLRMEIVPCKRFRVWYTKEPIYHTPTPISTHWHNYWIWFVSYPEGVGRVLVYLSHCIRGSLE